MEFSYIFNFIDFYKAKILKKYFNFEAILKLTHITNKFYIFKVYFSVVFVEKHKNNLNIEEHLLVAKNLNDLQQNFNV